MPRPERPIDPSAGPITRFAGDLRTLRQDAGVPTYRSMAEEVNYSPTVLSEAAAGRKLPTLPVTLAYVQACRGDCAEWERRWRAVGAESMPQSGEPSVVAGRRSRRWLIVPAAAVVAGIVGVALFLWLTESESGQRAEVMPENIPMANFANTHGVAEKVEPPASAVCSEHSQAKACLDVATKTFWVKDLPPGDGHHAAGYWVATDGSAHGDCHNYSKATGPWHVCRAVPLPDRGAIGLRAAVVEQETVVEWGPYVRLAG